MSVTFIFKKKRASDNICHAGSKANYNLLTEHALIRLSQIGSSYYLYPMLSEPAHLKNTLYDHHQY